MKKNQLMHTLGNTLLNCGQVDQAIKIFETITDIDPKNTEVSLKLADLLLETENFESAIETIKNAIRHASTLSVEIGLWNKLGNLFISNNDHTKAIKVYQTVDELSTRLANHPEVKNQEIELNVSTPVQLTEDSPHVWNELGLILFKVGSYDDAADSYISGLKLDNSLPFLHLNLAQVYVNQGKLEEAVTEFEATLDLVESDEEKLNLWTRILSCYKLQGETEKVDLTNQIMAAMTKASTSKTSSFIHLQVDKIIGTSALDGTNLDELVRSIRNHGVIQPLIVSPIENNENYQLIAGNRRLVAAKLVGLNEVPVIVRKVSEVESIELSLHENLHNSIKGSEELATNFQKLATNYDLSIEEIAHRIGVSAFSVANSIKAPQYGRTSREKATGDRSVEKELILKLIGRLDEDNGTDVQLCENFQEINNEEGANGVTGTNLWYMDDNASVVGIPVTETKHTGLFARAAKMLSHNPHNAKVLA